MKTLKSLLILTLIFFALKLTLSAQGFKVVKIKTSAVSDLCKEKIENKLTYEKGVKDVELDLETKIVTVKFIESETNYDKLVNVIIKTGYDADDKKADPKAYADLPEECKKSNIKKSGCGSTYMKSCSRHCSGHK